MVSTESIALRVISKNIRYATTDPFPGETLWSERRDRLVNELRLNSLHSKEALICCQEVLYEQLKDVLAGLQRYDDWDYVGWGRDDGDQAGEYSPIFFRPAVWTKIESNPVWLSKTPHKKGSKYPGAGSVRILTRVKFRHVHSGRIIVVYCTHLDDASGEARRYAAELICKLAVKDSGFPLILAGDFNSETSQEAYQCISESKLFKDANEVDDNLKYGNSNTFTGFGSEDEHPARIDYIFYHNMTKSNPLDRVALFHVLDYAVLSNRFDDGVYNSDHRAVVADLILC